MLMLEEQLQKQSHMRPQYKKTSKGWVRIE